MAGLYDDSGIMVDPVTGQVISAPQTNTPGPGIGDALSGLRQAMLPPTTTPPLPPQVAPMAPPQGPSGPPPDAPQQLAAVGLPPSGQPAPGAIQGAQEGLPPGSAQVADGALPVPPIPSTSPPPPVQPPAPPPVAPDDPLAGVSNNGRNNPLNLRYAGQDGATNANGFAAFQTPEAGIAAAKNQFSINASRGINTLSGLVSSWAPPNENDTAAYITNVSKATGIPPNAKIDLNDPAIQAKLIPAMSLMENGPAGKGGSQVASGGPPSTMTLANTSIPQGDPQGSLGGLQDGSSSFQMPFPNVGQPNRQNQLLAVASGLLGGKTLGQGLGKGLENLVGVNSQTQNQQMQANAQTQERQRMAQQQQYQNTMAGLAGQRVGIQAAPKPFGQPTIGKDDQGNEVVMQPMRDGSGNVTQVPLQGVTPAAIRASQNGQRITLAQQSLNAKLDPDTQARLKQSNVAAGNAEKDISATMSGQAQDEQGLSDINNAQTLIAQKPELMGPTLVNRWSRFAAANGLSGDAADLNALQKMTADQRNTALSSLTNGHVGGIRSNAELKNLSQAVADVNTSPAAATYILNMQKTQLQARQAWRQDLTDRYQNDPDSITGRNYNPTKQQFFDGYFKQNPLPDYASTSGTSSPAPSAHGSVASNSTAPGVSGVLRYDAKGNLIQ